MHKKRLFYCFVGCMSCLWIFLCCTQKLTFQRLTRSCNLSLNQRSNSHKVILVGADEACSSDHDFPLIVVVCSAVPNTEARRAIRETWGSVARGNSNHSLPARLVFLLGRSKNDILQNEIRRESDTYGDLIQEDFLDTYYNLTLKSLMMLKWIKMACPRAKFVMKTDDDMYVNIEVLLALLEQKDKPKLLIGYLYAGYKPERNKNSKWYASMSAFNESVYPNFLSGTGYVMSRDVVPMLYETALETPCFYLEDVFFTGICARKLKLTPQNHPGFSYRTRDFSVCLFRKIITSHHITPAGLRTIWTAMIKTVNCDI